MELKPLNSKERKTFYAKLNPYFGLPEKYKLDGILFVNEKGKYYLVNDKYAEIAGLIRTKVLGLYIAEINKFGEIRLSIEGSGLIGPDATEHILDLDDEEARLFLRGDDLDVSEKDLASQYFLLTNNKDFIGCGKVKSGTLLNFTPKSRRLH